jgi:hypothetical protein
MVINGTPSDIKSTTHPSVWYFEDPWNGYHYWMAHTPFPTTAYELPCICASNDGETWVVPAGLTNPIYTNPTNALVADTELAYYNGYLYCWFYSTISGVHLLHWMRSTDGVTWGDTTNTGIEGGTPCIVAKDDGTLMLWYMRSGACWMRTSSDNGATWGAEQAVTMPGGNITLWHMKIRYAQGIYHMLHQNPSSTPPVAPDSLFYLTSTDGLVWNGDTSRALRLVPKDFFGAYRSCFILRPSANGVTADIWVSVRRITNSLPTSDYSTQWKIALARNFVLSNDERPEPWRFILSAQQMTQEFPAGSANWTKAGVGGTLESTTWCLRLTTGVAAGNLSIARPNATNTFAMMPFVEPNGSRNDIRFRRPLVMSGSFIVSGSYAATTKAWILFPVGSGAMTEIPKTASDAWFGLRIDQYILNVIAWDGTTETVTSTGVTLTINVVYQFSIETSGNQLRLYLNGSFIGTYSGCPFNKLIQNQVWPLVAITNGDEAADRNILFGRIQVSRLPHSQFLSV